MKAKILVVDDDPAIRDVVALILQRNGFEVQANSGVTGLFDYIDGFVPDLLLLDVSLSGTDGRDLCREIKTREQASAFPVILFSANRNIWQSVEECGADDFLAKPFRSGELLAMVNKNLGRRS